MKPTKFLFVAAVVTSLLLPVRGMAQETSEESTDRMKVGLVLSSGGAKGFAHIGILKVLEEEGIPVHVVSGSSMGAVVGGLYSIGYTPHQIEEIAYDTDWQTLFNDNYKASSRDLSTFISSQDTYQLTFPIVDRRPNLPAGLIGGQNISMLLYRLTLPYHDIRDFSRFPVTFGAVATNLSTGRPRRFDSGYLPDVIRASAAIPSIFRPVNIEGELYIDGGVSRSIPAEDAKAMGADIVIISDVGEPIKPVDSLDTFVDVLFQAVGFHQIESDSVQEKIGDFYLRPEIEPYNSFSYDKIEELIQKGEEAARAILPELKALIDSVSVLGRPHRPEISAGYGESLYITNVTYENIDSRLARQTEIAMDLNPPEKVTYSDIERKINRLYSTGLFSLISYRVQDDPASRDGKMFSLDFSYSEPDRLGFSMRYDSRYKASLLFGAQLRNKLVWGDRFSAQLRLGEILGVSTHYDLPIALKPIVKFHTDLNVHRSPIDLFTETDQLATVEVEQLTLTPSLSIGLFNQVQLRAGIRSEFYNLNEAVGNILIFEDSQFRLTGVANLDFNRLNRPYFPTRGQRLRLQAEKQFLHEHNYVQLLADWQTSIPLLNGVELRTHLIAGHSTTSDLPFQYRFYLGGLTSNPLFELRRSPFWGYTSQQLSGSNMAAARSLLQFHLGNDFYLQTGWNAAHISDSRSWDPNDFDLNHGYGISLGALSVIGPINLSFSTPDFKENYAFKVDVGFTF